MVNRIVAALIMGVAFAGLAAFTPLQQPAAGATAAQPASARQMQGQQAMDAWWHTLEEGEKSRS